MDRPFAIGDMAISKTFGICFVCEESERQIRIMPSNGIARLYDKDGKWRHNEIKPDIVCIRTPRKGSKESRDIVAMLLREYLRIRRTFNKEFKKNYYELTPKSRELEIMGISFLNAYHKSKKMLL